MKKPEQFWPPRRTHVSVLASHLAALHEEAAASMRALARTAEQEEADDGTNDLAYRRRVIAEVNRYANAIGALLPLPTKPAGGEMQP